MERPQKSSNQSRWPGQPSVCLVIVFVAVNFLFQLILFFRWLVFLSWVVLFFEWLVFFNCIGFRWAFDFAGWVWALRLG